MLRRLRELLIGKRHHDYSKFIMSYDVRTLSKVERLYTFRVREELMTLLNIVQEE